MGVQEIEVQNLLCEHTCKGKGPPGLFRSQTTHGQRQERPKSLDTQPVSLRKAFFSPNHAHGRFCLSSLTLGTIARLLDFS